MAMKRSVISPTPGCSGTRTSLQAPEDKYQKTPSPKVYAVTDSDGKNKLLEIIKKAVWSNTSNTSNASSSFSDPSLVGLSQSPEEDICYKVLRNDVNGVRSRLVLSPHLLNGPVTTDGGTALNLASSFHTDVVQCLLVLGADVNIPDNNGNTPLWTACYFGSLDIVKLLLANGANPDGHEKSGDTPLMIASLKERFDIVKLLIEKKADVNKKNEKGQTAFNAQDGGGNTAIMKLIRAGEGGLLDLILQNKADVNIKNNNQETALHIAAKTRGSSLRPLLEKCDDRAMLVGAGQDKGLNAIDIAFKYCIYENIEILLQYGCKQSVIGNSPRLSVALSDYICMDLSHHVNLITTPQASPLHGIRNWPLSTVDQQRQFFDNLVNALAALLPDPAGIQQGLQNEGFSTFIIHKILYRIFSHLTASAPAEQAERNQGIRQCLIGLLQESDLYTVFSGKGLSAQSEFALNRMVRLQLNLLLQAAQDPQTAPVLN
jgi:hypothetical protein